MEALFDFLHLCEIPYDKIVNGLRLDGQLAAVQILTICSDRPRWKPKHSLGYEYDANRVLGTGWRYKVFIGKFKNRTYAIKRLRGQRSNFVNLKETLEIVRILPSHENVTRMYHVEQTKRGDILLGIDMCTFSLQQCIENKTRLPSKKNVLQQATLGLNFLHENNINHWNVKPSNILVQFTTSDIIAKISDYAIAASDGHLEALRKKLKNEISTVCWISPELLTHLWEGKDSSHFPVRAY